MENILFEKLLNSCSELTCTLYWKRTDIPFNRRYDFRFDWERATFFWSRLQCAFEMKNYACLRAYIQRALHARSVRVSRRKREEAPDRCRRRPRRRRRWSRAVLTLLSSRHNSCTFSVLFWEEILHGEEVCFCPDLSRGKLPGSGLPRAWARPNTNLWTSQDPTRLVARL